MIQAFFPIKIALRATPESLAGHSFSTTKLLEGRDYGLPRKYAVSGIRLRVVYFLMKRTISDSVEYSDITLS